MSHATMNAAPGWCLRFLSGAVRGRSIALRAGTQVAGAAQACEVLLPPSDAQAQHLEFKVGELLLSVRCLPGAEARINGEPMPATRRSVVVGDVITVGRIDFQIERSYGAVDVDLSADAGPDSMFLPPEPADAAAAVPAAARSTGRGRTWAVGALVWLLAMAGGWWVMGSSASERRGGAAPELPAIEAVLKDYPEAEVLAGSNGFVVKGFVESQARRQALQRALQPFGPRVTVSVHAVDELIEQARRFVSDPGLAVTYAGKGRLVVSGKTEKDEVRDLLHRLGEDLHPAVVVSDRVQYARPKPAPVAAVQRDQWEAWQRALPSRMVSVTEDGHGLRYIQLADGSLYFEGSVLKSGVELKDLRTQAPPVPEAGP